MSAQDDASAPATATESIKVEEPVVAAEVAPDVDVKNAEPVAEVSPEVEVSLIMSSSLSEVLSSPNGSRLMPLQSLSRPIARKL